MRRRNFILATDSYKGSHWNQLPPGTTKSFGFFESRGGAFPSVLFFGLQYYLKEFFEGPVITEEDILEARDVWGLHFGNKNIFNEAGWRHILNKHGGHLPLEIRAIPEGTKVPISNALITAENTDDAVPWLTNYTDSLQTMLWYPCTVAMQSYAMRQIILRALERTGDPALIDFKLHDFGFRGSTSYESASIGAAAHLVNFKGTDTVPGLLMARDIYHERMAGFSIPAAEHSTITAWGRTREADAYRNMLNQFPDMVAVVSDSYDIFHACGEIWGRELHDQVMNHKGTLVVRPDSGHPPTVVVKVLEILGAAFGFTVNHKGFRVLDPHVRVIQGDGIDITMLQLILDAMETAGWSADNVAFGSGGGLLQKVNRDTQSFAFKCSAVKIYNMWHDVMKNPVTDPGKRSKAGRLKLVRDGASWQTVPMNQNHLPNLLEPVFRNGVVLRDQSFADIRQRAMAA